MDKNLELGLQKLISDAQQQNEARIKQLTGENIHLRNVISELHKITGQYLNSEPEPKISEQPKSELYVNNTAERLVGGRRSRATMTDEQVYEARVRYAKGETQASIKKDMKLRVGNISDMINGKTYCHVPMPKAEDVAIGEQPDVVFPDSVPDDKAKVEVPKPKTEPVIINPANILQEGGWKAVLASVQSEYLFNQLNVRNITYHDHNGRISRSNLGRIIMHAIVPGATKSISAWNGNIGVDSYSYSQLTGRMAFGLKAGFGADHENSNNYAFWLFRQLSSPSRRGLEEMARFWDGIEVRPGSNPMSAIISCLKAWFGEAWYNTLMEYDTPVK